MAVAATTTRIPYKGSQLRAIVVSDSTTYNPPLRAVYVGGATGDVALTVMQRSAAGVNTNTNITYSSVPAGGTISQVGPIGAVLSTGTTATGLIGIE